MYTIKKKQSKLKEPLISSLNLKDRLGFKLIFCLCQQRHPKRGLELCRGKQVTIISTVTIHCWSLNQEMRFPGKCLAKQNKKALQPESSLELQDDKQTKTVASSFEATVSNYF